MSFINYYPQPMQKIRTSTFDVSLVCYTAIFITCTVCILWYVYAINYRYSSDRISNKILKKYNKTITDNQTMNASNGQINAAKTEASAVITVLFKGIEGTISSQETVKLPVVSNCSPINKKCIAL